MAMAYNQSIEELRGITNSLNAAIPLVTQPAKFEEMTDLLNEVSEGLKSENISKVSPHLRPLGTSLKILVSSDSPLLHSVMFQAYLVEIVESFQEVLTLLQAGALPDPNIIQEIRTNAEFLIRLAGRMLYRYKIVINFEADYDAKSLRAFMVAKDLSKVVRFISVNPDISQQQNPNLDGGFHLEVLSQASPQQLYDIVMQVLAVESCQIFVEKQEREVVYLDPPSSPDSVDTRMEKFLNE